MTKFRVGNRAFLNHAGFHEDAAFGYALEIGDRGYFEGVISIRDCSNSITLELNVHSDEWVENSEFKIDTMIRLLREAKRDLRKARKVYERIQKKKTKEKANETTDPVS